MSKKDVFKNIIRYEVVKSFKDTYSINTGYMTEKQENLVECIAERLYTLFGDSMTVKELQEKLSEFQLV